MAKAPTNASGDEPQASELSKPTSRDVVIRDAIITSLGRPPGLYRVAVLPLWKGHYRVNVLAGPDSTCVCIPHSYFVEASDDGVITSVTPPLVRLYP